MPRPTKRTDITEQNVLKALSEGNTRTASAAYARISYDTLSRMIKEDADFAQAVAEADAEMKCVAIIRKAATPHTVTVVREKECKVDGISHIERQTTTKKEFNWQAASWLLERRWPASWRQRKSIDVGQLTDEQIISLLEDGAEDGSGPEGAEDGESGTV